MRCTCVSTQMFRWLLNDRISTRFAVLRPTPGSVSSSSIVPGTRPPNRSISRRHVAFDMPRFVAIEADGIDQPLEPPDRQLRHPFRRRRDGEQRADAAVRDASRVCADSIVAIST